MFFLGFSYGVSITLLQILISLRFPVHPSKGVHWCSTKRLFEHSKTTVHWCYEKITAPKIYAYFAYFSAKHPGWSFFKYTRRPSWDFSEKLFRAARPATRHVLKKAFL